MKHYVLVHGGCHGAWCWYKVKPMLEHSGHRVTVFDLTAHGVNMSRVEDIQTLEDFAKPLLEVLESFGSDDKVVLVAHSLGGIPAALAADMFPSKISVAVFVTSFMPDTTNPPSYVFEKFLGSITEEERMDFELGSYGTDDHPLKTAFLGPNYLKNMYLLSPIEDYELAKMLMRVTPAITSNLTGTKSLTAQGYGSISRVYIVCGEDKGIRVDFQRWMIENSPVKEVMEIKDADHMPMFSKPHELCDRLLKIADKYP
ncbi:hydroxynitrile lyase like protein [Arabidopsis thaliana]|jgi:polyneuridine-aldehyde esterase|uniref:Methylesterase 9 n=3 Tax=Arabidopsis TaxID=3701 RepID=MES9_ARATH|nr:methyl esterase 9 [Arabidopsis thaliana]O23171.1 RecName: Full=Methylesterase 9; Short=AtMES9 [Arabidopsis thaliana]KAG7618725.1 Alpha/beta hydrolase fold-1 [Arabidopsis thaliana x Arabidopsis arenosa]AAP12876.1 At4g37150 [Arabidopsis thaliana]AEE86759.1 methyl esterase 9 [Arabidopsis thaliana]OAP00306.1 MES9 [Arabidopsis thaliana]CAB16760.1 hydroxynitrile lyase like protein [Arabidopsis thaliana]|eukprot:NP_195432.1 methyl esterase 9 [Arabidopsis thaliana]